MKDDAPFVSVIIPTHNRRDLLKDSIFSLYKQTYPKENYEIIIVDNASDDGTQELIQSLQHDAPCILRYYRQEAGGHGTARMFGVAEARGSVIAFTDSDCIADASWIEKGVSGLTDGVGLVQGKTVSNPAQIERTFSITQNIFAEDGTYETCNIFYPKIVLDQVGGFSKDFIDLDCFGQPKFGCEDTDLGWKVKDLGLKTRFVEDAIVYHHVFHVSPWKILFNYKKFQIFFYGWPKVVKKHPQIRKKTLFLGFLKRDRLFFDLFVLSSVMGIFAHHLFFILGVPYIIQLLIRSFRYRPLRRYPHGVVVFIFFFLNDLIEFLLLLAGSIWHRTLIL